MHQLEQAITNDNLIIFVGSGLSKRFGLPDWNKMVIDIIKNVNRPDLSPFISILNTGTTLSAVDVLEFLKGEKKEIHDYIQKSFKLEDSQDFSLHTKILELSKKIITTNYDNAFEIASKRTITPSKPTSKYTINELNKGGNPFIFKLHGSFEEPDNCIVFKEDYEKLYNENNNEAAPEKLKALFSNSTFLFIGFSFNDPEINFIFDRMNKVFGGNNKHYIITPEFDDFKKYAFLEQIKIDDFSKLESKINELLKLKLKASPIDLQSNKSEVLIDNIPNNSKIAVLFPNPIDLDLGEDLKNAIKPFEEIEANLYLGALNVRTLQEVDEFDLVIIISKTFKDKIYIEDDNLKSNLLTSKEICENIPNQNIPILFITNEFIDINSLNYSIINIGSYRNNIIKRFTYKLTKEKKYFFDDVEIKSNRFLWSNVFLEKGVCKKISFYGNDRDLPIGKKCLSSVIGRTEEQINIASKLLSITYTSKVLNVKASGGLGKTTLIKKIAYELYNRGYYKKGVNFGNCENIRNYEDFEDLLISGFNLNDILNFKEYLIENFSNDKLDLLIILDNFETVVNNLTKESFNRVTELLKFSSDYGNIVITSREKISNEDFEDVFTLSQMITDDAVNLFKKFYDKKIDDKELKILREDILENLLANNPLAIKLVTTSRSPIPISDLRDQIKDYFFESINEEFSDVFKNNVDLNIERTKSIYQSINYSYLSLTVRQRLAFELLSLFPDGIGLTNFKKCFQKNRSKNNISDTELKQLENKSLVENYNGILQLQPIIRRFADFQFNKHKENKQKYCIDAYDYNCYVIDFLQLIRKKQSYSNALKSFSNVKNNAIKVLDYIPDIKIEDKGSVTKKEYFINYIYELYDYLTNENILIDFKKKVDNLIPFFSDVKDADKLIEVLNLRRIYYDVEFDKSYEELSKFLPVEKILERKFDEENYIESIWKNLVSRIHSMEGYTLIYIESQIKNKTYKDSLFGEYHYLGFENIELLKKVNPFYYFENKLRNNKLDTNEIEMYIDNLYMEQHLQIMQCTYTLSKVKKIEIKTIKKLVVTNPYTKGLKELMFAFNTDKKEDKKMHYEKAIKNLTHIKYYYLEALYHYCLFLKENEFDDYRSMIDDGLNLARKFKYQYIDYLFTNICSPNKNNYDFSYGYYGLEDIEDFVKANIVEWGKLQLDSYNN